MEQPKWLRKSFFKYAELPNPQSSAIRPIGVEVSASSEQTRFSRAVWIAALTVVPVMAL